jgi:hypothetical protein
MTRRKVTYDDCGDGDAAESVECRNARRQTRPGAAAVTGIRSNLWAVFGGRFLGGRRGSEDSGDADAATVPQ